MLTDVMVRQAKVTGTPYAIADYDGLYLHISAIGTRAWYFRYTWLDQRARLSLGSYPELSLREARELRDQARSLIAKGINPRLDRKQKRQATKLAGQNTFMAVYEKWMEHRQLTLEEGRQSSLSQIRRVFKKDVFPHLKRLTIYEITRPILLEIIGRIEKRESLSVAEKVRAWFKQLFDYAMVVIPSMETNPANDLHVVAVPLPPVEHNPFLRMQELPEFLQTMRKYPGMLKTQLAIRLLLLTGVRTLSSGMVRMVPSWNTNVMLRTWPRTHESVQSPAAVPLKTAPATSGMSMPLAVRLSGPTRTLNGYGSFTVPSIGTRPINAVIATEPINVEFVGTV